MTATASGGTINYGVDNKLSSSPVMMNVTAIASGATTNFGVFNLSSAPMLMNVSATASGERTTMAWMTIRHRR